MSKRMLYMSVVAVHAACGAALSVPASAMPLAGALAVENMAGVGPIPVWYYREWGGYGPAYALDEEPRYYRRPYRYRYYEAYDGPSYGYARRYHDDYVPRYYRAPLYRRDDALDYCASRFQSWDPDTGTYLGFDGYRHPCP